MNTARVAVAPSEPFLKTWGRRSVTIPGYLLAALTMLAMAPVLLPIAAVGDLVRQRRFAFVRSLLMVYVYLLAEAAGIVASFAIWATAGGWRKRPSATYLERNFALQCRWASVLFWSARRVFALRLEVEGEVDVTAGPVVVIGRHVSPVDNLVPAVFLSARHGMRLRWVINRWLRRDPCLDIVGSRLPNVFVDASRGESGGQAARVGALAEDLGPNEGVLIYPEGALFNPGRRDRAVTRLAATDLAASDRAAALKHLLAPRTGGVIAALSAAPAADVILCRHTGLESVGNYHAFLSGALVRTRVRIQFLRIARQSIPADAAGQVEWLWNTWAELDRWISGERDNGNLTPTTQPMGGP